MREAIGGTWLFGLVITFIVFFASFLAVSINYSKAFNVKNNVVDLISKYEGNNPCARKHIESYLRTTGYLVAGRCPEVDPSTKKCLYTGYSSDGRVITDNTTKTYYWIRNDMTDNTSTMDKKFYRVVIFFKIDLPMFGDIATFRINGETESIPFANENTTC